MQALETPRETIRETWGRSGRSVLGQARKRDGAPRRRSQLAAPPSAELAPVAPAGSDAAEEAPKAAAAVEELAVREGPTLDVLAVETPVNTSTYLPPSGPEVDGLQLYLREAGRSSLLTAEDEVRLGQEMEAGRRSRARLESSEATSAELPRLMLEVDRGEAARERLISSNLRLVISLAKQHLGPGVEFSDLIQEGNLGLMRAADRFDWRKGNRFSTYALWWIRQAVSCAVGDQSRSIRLPSHMMDTLSRLAKTEQRLTQELGRYATDREVCQALAISISRLADLRQARERPSSLDVPVGEDGDAELSDLVEDQVALTPMAAVLEGSLRDQVAQVLGTLDPRERTVICLRFGLEDDHTRTLEEVGRELQITKERVRQIEGRALRKLRHSTRSRWLVEYAE